jgi:hypothetical protein
MLSRRSICFFSSSAVFSQLADQRLIIVSSIVGWKRIVLMPTPKTFKPRLWSNLYSGLGIVPMPRTPWSSNTSTSGCVSRALTMSVIT